MSDNLAAERAIEHVVERLGIQTSTAQGDTLAEKLGYQLRDSDDINDYDFNDIELPEEIRQIIMAQEVKADPISHADAVNGLARVRKMHPIAAKTTLEQTLPCICCCAPVCRSSPNDEEDSDDSDFILEDETNPDKLTKDQLATAKQIEERNLVVKTILKRYNGRYKGTRYLPDAKKAAGLIKPKPKVVVELNPDEVDEEGEPGIIEEEVKEEVKDITQSIPLAKYGFGIETYIMLLYSLAKTFACCAVLAGIVSYMYRMNGNIKSPNFMSNIAKQSIGNLQGARSMCFTTLKGIRAVEQELKCPKGKIHELVNFGVVAAPASANSSQYIKPNDYLYKEHETKFGNNFCGDPTKDLNAEDNCTMAYKEDLVRQKFKTDCVGKNNCTFNMQDPSLLDWENSALKATCKEPATRLYIQATCLLTNEELFMNRIVGCIACFVFGIIGVVFYEYVQTQKNNANAKLEKYDFANCTASDYTVRMDLPRKWYDAFLEKQKSRRKGRELDVEIFIGEALTKHIKDLDPILNIDLDDPKYEDKTTIKIADVRIGYHNRELIMKLAERGTLITNDADKVDIVEKDQQIRELIKEHAEKMAVPVCAFITFTSQEAKERCVHYCFKKDSEGYANPKYKEVGPVMSLDVELTVTDAPEPSDIIWENLQISPNRIKCNECITYLILTAFLIGVFIFFVILKFKAGQNAMKYPKTISCAAIRSLFGTLEKASGKVTFNTEQEADFKKIAIADQELTRQALGGGYYQCFCKQFGKNAICDDYKYDLRFGQALTMGVTFSVQIVNFILKKLVKYLVEKIGYHTISEQITTIMMATFVSAFLNTGIIPLLTNANLKYTEILGRLIPLTAQYSDFDESWYVSIGSQLFRTILIQACMPYVSICIAVSTAKAKRWMDSGFPGARKEWELERVMTPYDIERAQEEWIDKDPDNNTAENWPGPSKDNVPATKKTTVQQFVNLYAGPEFLIYSQYSTMLVITFVTFLYGMLMPTLFLVAAFAMVNMQICDNLSLTYFYQKPPMYDGKLNDRAIAILQAAPIMMFLFGYWALSNTQFFMNIAPERTFTNRAPNPKHELISFHHGLNQGTMALCVLIFWGVRIFWDWIVRPCAAVCKKETDEKEVIAHDEDLPQYWAAIPGNTQKTWYAQEIYDQKVSGIINLSYQQMKDLQTTQREMKDRTISSQHSYDILQLEAYKTRFQYYRIIDRKLPAEALAVINDVEKEEGEDGKDQDVNDWAATFDYHEIPEWEESDMIFLALNTDANKRRTKKKGGNTAQSDYEKLAEKLFRQYTGLKTKKFIQEKAEEAAKAKEERDAKAEDGFPDGSH